MALWGERVSEKQAARNPMRQQGLERLTADIGIFPTRIASEVLKYANLDRTIDTASLRDALERYASEQLQRFLCADENGKKIAALTSQPVAPEDVQAATCLTAIWGEYQPSMHGIYARDTAAQAICRIDQTIAHSLSVLQFGAHCMVSADIGAQR